MNSYEDTYENRRFVIVTGRINHLLIDRETEDYLWKENEHDLLWDRDGMQGMIYKQRLMNAIRLRNEKRAAGLTLPPLTFSWNDVTPLSSGAATSRVRRQSPSR